MTEEVVGFSSSQRAWFLEAYGHRCAFYSKIRGKWLRCRNTDRLQLHHIYPRGFYRENMHPDFNVNGSQNGIILCEDHHVGKFGVHPDTYRARLAYRGGDKNAFNEMMDIRKELNKAGIPYWNTCYDLMFIRTNQRFVGRYHAKKFKYPSNGNRGLNGRLR